VAVIVTPLSIAATFAAKAATTTIPIVFSSGIDPVQAGLVHTLNRPGGNVTGFVTMNNEIGTKRLQLLRELLPAAARFAALVNPATPLIAEAITKDLQAGASAMGVPIEIFAATTNRDIDAAFANLVQKRVDALVVSPDLFFTSRRAQIVTQAARHAMPVIYFSREFADAGGLMSYGSSQTDPYRYAAIYTGRILKGEKPADLPVARPTKFEFVINLQAARILSIDVPAMLIAQADEVIE
jgi:putative ABC transport system substrate-binding protein